MVLSHRLQRIADLVRPGVVMADIGTDHGNLPAALLEKGKVTFAVATDIHPKPLEKARLLLEQSGFSEQSDCRLGNGLVPLKDNECDDIVIAGMGGLMIRDILEGSEERARQAGQLILQPMNNTAVLREYLAAHHYRIIHESIVAEKGYFYEIIVIQNGWMRSLTPAEKTIGYAPVRREDQAFRAFVIEGIEKTKAILETVSLKNTENARKRAEACKALLDALTKEVQN